MNNKPEDVLKTWIKEKINIVFLYNNRVFDDL